MWMHVSSALLPLTGKNRCELELSVLDEGMRVGNEGRECYIINQVKDLFVREIALPLQSIQNP